MINSKVLKIGQITKSHCVSEFNVSLVNNFQFQLGRWRRSFPFGSLLSNPEYSKCQIVLVERRKFMAATCCKVLNISENWRVSSFLHAHTDPVVIFARFFHPTGDNPTYFLNFRLFHLFAHCFSTFAFRLLWCGFCLERAREGRKLSLRH